MDDQFWFNVENYNLTEFIDVNKETLGMSPNALKNFLDQNAELRADGYAYNKKTDSRISACVPMHTFGIPCEIEQLIERMEKRSYAIRDPVIKQGDAGEFFFIIYKGQVVSHS